jgi:hypothetical protein
MFKANPVSNSLFGSAIHIPGTGTGEKIGRQIWLKARYRIRQKQTEGWEIDQPSASRTKPLVP